MKTYEIILFDADGTLLDFAKAEDRGIESLLARFGVPVTAENKEKYSVLNKSYWQRLEKGEFTRDEILGLRFEDFFGSFGITVDGREVDRLYRETRDTSSDLIEGAEEILTYLKEKYKLYIVTNGVATTQNRRLGDSGLKKYFDGIFISEEAGAQKPQEEFFEYCFRHMGRRDVENMLVVGDSLTSDIRGANRSGIDACWYNPKGEENTAGVKVDYEIHDLSELKKIL